MQASAALALLHQRVQLGRCRVNLRTLDCVDDNSGGIGRPVPAPARGAPLVAMIRRRQQERRSSSLNWRLRVRHLFGNRLDCDAAKRNQIMLCPPNAVSVLLDLSVRQLAVWTRPATIEKEIVWGERSHSFSLCGWQGRRGLGKEHPWLQKQFECLPSIARLVKNGRLNLFSYSEPV